MNSVNVVQFGGRCCTHRFPTFSRRDFLIWRGRNNAVGQRRTAFQTSNIRRYRSVAFIHCPSVITWLAEEDAGPTKRSPYLSTTSEGEFWLYAVGVMVSDKIWFLGTSPERMPPKWCNRKKSEESFYILAAPCNVRRLSAILRQHPNETF